MQIVFPKTSLSIMLASLPCIALQACEHARPVQMQTVQAFIAGQAFTLELALDDASRDRGLGGRTSVAPNQGMLFAFPKDEWCDFVMRDCLIPLDLLYLDSAGVILAMHEMKVEAPRTPAEQAGESGEVLYLQRLTPYPSGEPARFAVEIPAGVIQQKKIQIGDRVEFEYADVMKLAR